MQTQRFKFKQHLQAWHQISLANLPFALWSRVRSKARRRHLLLYLDTAGAVRAESWQLLTRNFAWEWCLSTVDRPQNASTHPSPTNCSHSSIAFYLSFYLAVKKGTCSVVTWSVLISRMISRAVKQMGNYLFWLSARQFGDFFVHVTVF